MDIEHVNPETLFRLDGFTQVVTATGASRLAFIAGQGSFDRELRLIGDGDLHAQTVQAFRNLRAAVASVGGGIEHIVSSNMYIVGLDAEKVGIFTRAMAEALDGQPFPPNASTMIGVQALAGEGMLIEISAVAVLP